MHIQTFHDPVTATFSHIVVDPQTNKCAILDSVLDFDPVTGKVQTTNADRLVAYIQENNLTLEWILETHIHADHISASRYLKEKLGGRTAMGARIKEVIAHWRPYFETEEDTPLSGEQFDHLFEEEENFMLGTLNFTYWNTPGHTPACGCYLVEGAIFVGDTVFAPHIGTARCDFPGGSAGDMYDSVQRIYTLPDSTTIYLCHDYPKEGAAPLSQITVGEQKKQNIMIRPETTRTDYIAQREARDATLSAPRLILPSIQTNIRAGSFGDPSPKGKKFIKIPLKSI